MTSPHAIRSKPDPKAAERDAATVVFYLFGAMREGDTRNGHEADAAFNAACRLLGVDRKKLVANEQIVEGAGESG